MKLLSKKVMTGLMVGALSLSISTSVSNALNPEKNKYYSIHLPEDSNKVWDVYTEGTYDEAGIILYGQNGKDNQQFVFFPLDGGNYAIVNKNSGKPVVYGDASPWAKDPDWGVSRQIGGQGMVYQSSWTGAPSDQWYLRQCKEKILYGNHEIVNQGNSKVASYGYIGSSVLYTEYVKMNEANPLDTNKAFYISDHPVNQADKSPYGSFKLPELPKTGTRPEAPKYTDAKDPDEQLPQTTNSVVVGASLIPCIMVNDGQTSDYTKIHNTPYYTLEKEEYWEKVASTVLTPGSSQSFTYKTGMSSTDQTKMTETLSMKIGADFGLQFLGKIGPLKGEITKTIQTETSSSSGQVVEDTSTTNFKCNSDRSKGFTQYQLATKYTLKRADGSSVSGSWIVKNPRETRIRETK